MTEAEAVRVGWRVVVALVAIIAACGVITGIGIMWQSRRER